MKHTGLAGACLKFVLLFTGFIVALNSTAQSSRISDKNNIGWYAAFATIKIAPKWSIHYEYQWRRDDFAKHWQQSLMRGGINYQIDNDVTLRAGYGWIETYSYGEFPLNAFGKQFTEHRIFQAALIKSTIGRWEFNHRYMVEQRWVGRYATPTSNRHDDYVYTNRLRYQGRVQLPLLENREFYLAAYDELFIGFGKNVGENIFDQNRVALLAGYKLNNNIKIEGGYLNQTVQLGREVLGRNVFQYNHGFIISGIFNL